MALGCKSRAPAHTASALETNLPPARPVRLCTALAPACRRGLRWRCPRETVDSVARLALPARDRRQRGPAGAARARAVDSVARPRPWPKATSSESRGDLPTALDAAFATAHAFCVAIRQRGDDLLSSATLAARLKAEAPQALTLIDLAHRLGMKHYDKREIESLLRDLARRGDIERVGRMRWRHRPESSGPGGADGQSARALARAAERGRAESPEAVFTTDDQSTGQTVAGAPKQRGRARNPDLVVAKARGRRQVSSAAGLTGALRRTRSGHSFVELDTQPVGQKGDVRIDDGDENGAWPGDRVRVALAPQRRSDLRAKGVIVEILARSHQTVVGVLQASTDRRGGEARWALFPDDERLPPIEIVSAKAVKAESPGIHRRKHRHSPEDEPAEPAAEAWREEQSLEAAGLTLDPSAQGARVLARITSWSEARRGVRGRVERFLGGLDDPDTQAEMITSEFNIPVAIAAEAEREAKRVAREPEADDLVGRVDLREALFVTIDPATARDHDDAVCLESRPEGGWRVWVAIADVSHYVEEGGALDREAASRSTSVYFPDRAVPMLPEALSSHACSLVPDHDRLVLVAEMDYLADGVRHDQRFYPAVIRSRARLSYEQVAALLAETDLEPLEAERRSLGPIVPMLGQLQILMRQLLRRRLAAGALDLDLPEALLDLSEEGRTIGIRLAPRNDAHRLIEELMLEANRAVASFIELQGLPLPYRIHEEPDPADIETLNGVLAAAGARVEMRHDRVRPRDVARALATLATHRLGRVFSRRVLRALKQARYSTENQGHFGLAFETYCHFTSPIRRYPDLLVHRQLHSIFAKRQAEARSRAGLLVDEAQRSSTHERRAMDAERAMVDMKKAEFMLGHLFEPEAAVVTGVEKFGVFVELESMPIEGLLPSDTLGGFWTLDARSGSLVESGSRRRIRLGDRLEVEATKVSLAQRRIVFELVGEIPRTTSRRGESE